MTRSIFCWALLVAAPVLAAQQAQTPTLPYQLPATMQQHRFFIKAQAPSGKVLRLFTDTGGGMNLTTSGADKLGVAYQSPDNPARQPAGTTTWPNYVGPWIPSPKSARPDMQIPILAPPPGVTFDGMLGTAWFGDRHWEFDYRAGTLRLLPDGVLPKADPAHVVTLGFKTDDRGKHTTHFPRIPARIDGEDLQFLFDTGASFRLDEAAAGTLGDASIRERAGNFITASVMRGWRERHPDWQYLEKGDIGMPMIRVPDIELAGYHTGPAWFSMRPDKAFHEYMAQWMDTPVDGALGGEAFRSFRISVDYPSATAVFEQ